jgi:hypothetical protein
MHNHALNPNPFQYYQHHNKIPRFTVTLAAREVHHSVVGYKEHSALLKKAGLPHLSKKRYYNLQRKEEKGTLTRQAELENILALLKEENVHI